jgi:hypothetical protein
MVCFELAFRLVTIQRKFFAVWPTLQFVFKSVVVVETYECVECVKNSLYRRKLDSSLALMLNPGSFHDGAGESQK